VTYAAEHGVDVDVRATGHGAQVVTRPTVLVHTGRLDELVVDPAGRVRIGAGVCWARVIEAAAAHGLAGLAGSSPGVGVVGYLTGGGMGPVARTFGFASDHVTAIEVVTGDGEIRRATATENEDLFWGLRGGKGALGIVTAVEMDLPAVAEIFGGALYFAGGDIPAVIERWREWSQQLPEQASTSVAILRLPPLPHVPPPLAGQVAVAVRFAWVGDPAEGAAVFQPMRDVATPVLGDVGMMPYAAIGAIHADPVDPMPFHESTVLLRELPPEAVGALLELVGPEAECPQVIVELRLLGGAVARPGRHASAMCHRDAAYTLMTIGIGVPPVREATVAHAAQVLACVGPWSTGHRLPNFGAGADPAGPAGAYDEQTLARLAELAVRYDPRGVLSAARPLRDLAGPTIPAQAGPA
jgi:hypothetical protein